jgi:MSHA pilin protein MshD
MTARHSHLQLGFTLIELVTGILVLAVALTVMTGSLFPQAERSVTPWMQVRSAELAQSLMNDVMSRRYDEQSFKFGNLRCGEDGANACTDWAVINSCNSAEENRRDLYDDVDDFNCLSVSGNEITNVENESLGNKYSSFSAQVSVTQAQNTFLGNPAKLVTVTVTPPKGDPIVYSSYKVNY